MILVVLACVLAGVAIGAMTDFGIGIAWALGVAAGAGLGIMFVSGIDGRSRE